jgi:ATP-dependent helicase/nuclease subunit B
MAIQRHFTGWDAPATDKVREFLLPAEVHGPVDLAKDLIVVPTRQAGRRLREALAMHCASHKTALLSPRVEEPTYFLQPKERGSSTVASPLEMTAVWVDVLMKADLSQYSGLFPVRVPAQDFTWALHTAEMIQKLRKDLADGGYLINQVCRDFGSLLEEPERWRDLAALETALMERLGSLGLMDSCQTMIRCSENPEVSKGIDRIVVAAVPDPTPLMVRALEHLADKIPIVVLVHAPETLADQFDDRGRPQTAKWQERHIDIPDADTSVILAGSPWAQSMKALEMMAAEAGRFGPADIAIGVPDSQVTPFLSADLAERGLVPFDPAGKSAAQHPLYQLLEAFQGLVNEATYQAFSAMVRNADVLDFLEREQKLPPRRVLEELDHFQNQRLPQTLEDIEQGLFLKTKEEEHQGFPNLAKAAGFILEQVRTFEAKDVDGALRAFLQRIYEVRTLNPRHPDDADFITVAELIDKSLRQLASDSVAALGLEKRQALELLLSALRSQPYYPEPENAVIDLEGWLELPWNDAPFLIVTGMNDGEVPTSRLGDVFLPDSLRRQLGLRHDSDWLARDAYVMSALIESRREQGRVCFIAGKTGSTGDVLKPSRLLFLCSDEELPGRAERLFGNPAETRANFPSSISFRLDARPPWDTPARKLEPTRIPVTAFRDYLACPFRFYLKRILEMEEVEYEKTELDPMDFGSLVHDVLHEMAQDEEMRCCQDAGELQDFLCARAEDWAATRYGRQRPLQVEFQMESAKQRLREAARVQARLTREGWEILSSEREIGGELEGLLIRGKIDRIDRHRETGRIRLLDYKTSERAQTPGEAHMASLPKDQEMADYVKVAVSGGEKRWIDLQLPLYAILLAADGEFQGPYELGYFNLPKALPETDVAIWADFSEGLAESARGCASGVIRDIRGRRFWPPAAKVRYEDFEKLFTGDAVDCVDGEAFEAYLRGERA